MKSLINGKLFQRVLLITGLGLIVAALVLAACSIHIPWQAQKASPLLPSNISGSILDANGKPISGAIVQIKGTPNKTTTGADGGYTLSGEGLGGKNVATITAWSTGHFVGWVSPEYYP